MTKEKSALHEPLPTQKKPRPKNPVLLSLPTHTHMYGTLVDALRPLFVQAGKLESTWNRSNFEKRPIQRPLFICGAARSGSSALLEGVYKTEAFAIHRNKDYPFVDTPIMWNRFISVPTGRDRIPIERAGDDGLNITSESPETLEEMLWTPFFDNLHNPAKDNRLRSDTVNPDFERYYKDNIQKMLLAQRKNRYASKNNYALMRIKYLNRIFPDACFVVVIRHPGPQIASMIKQHRLFLKWERKNPRMAQYVRRIKYFDLGAGRRSINIGDSDITHEISQCWKSGDDISGYAHLWNHLYRYVYDHLIEDPALKNNLIVLRYEDLCENPSAVLRRVLRMVNFDLGDEKLFPIVDGIRAPNYYESGFTDEERRRIRAITGQTSSLFYR